MMNDSREVKEEDGSEVKENIADQNGLYGLNNMNEIYKNEVNFYKADD